MERHALTKLHGVACEVRSVKTILDILYTYTHKQKIYT